MTSKRRRAQTALPDKTIVSGTEAKILAQNEEENVKDFTTVEAVLH